MGPIEEGSDAMSVTVMGFQFLSQNVCLRSRVLYICKVADQEQQFLNFDRFVILGRFIGTQSRA